MNDTTEQIAAVFARTRDPTSADIAYALKLRGFSQRAIAKKHGLSPSTVCNVISGSDTSRRVAQYIADLIGLPIEQLWPGKYDTPRQPRKPRNPSRRKPS